MKFAFAVLLAVVSCGESREEKPFKRDPAKFNSYLGMWDCGGNKVSITYRNSGAGNWFDHEKVAGKYKEISDTEVLLNDLEGREYAVLRYAKEADVSLIRSGSTWPCKRL